MTETDPGGPDPTPTAGTTGAHRKKVGEPITPDERESLNIPPKQPIGTPTAEADDLGVPPSERDGTPRLAPGSAAGSASTTGAGAAGSATATGSAAGSGPATATTATGAAGSTGGSVTASGAPPAGAEGGTPGTTVTGASAGDLDEKESVRRDIEEARRELGDTVEALVHKTDVKGRVQETATQVGDDLRRMGTATAATATDLVERVRGAAPEMVGRMREAAPEMVGRVKEKTPVELRSAAEKVGTEAGKRPVATAATVVALLLVLLRILRRGKRKQGR
ncbi:hypothetical protein FHS43_002774 [Streptosporangium becharense]|uniref:DUF3618 domain-containing protein n=1 Tax=Streptosporangium becharense TaxID=1816182 RepID=A0A7W9ILT1_9ACTN|nr:DUF3618 domain-containing protein [Streptosporangium becharense]MBB2911501.1 hypothetical protein [Streptosporangium becharense]MBB5822681.1 hypothetical protein [Streptosporangium becharense]